MSVWPNTPQLQTSIHGRVYAAIPRKSLNLYTIAQSKRVRARRLTPAQSVGSSEMRNGEPAGAVDLSRDAICSHSVPLEPAPRVCRKGSADARNIIHDDVLPF